MEKLSPSFARSLTDVCGHYLEIVEPCMSDEPISGVSRPQRFVSGAGEEEPWPLSLLEFSVALWHFTLPVLDDISDVALIGLLWYVALAGIERNLLFLVTVLLVACWIPFSLLDTDESRGLCFERVFRFLNGCHDLRLEPVFVKIGKRGKAIWGARRSTPFVGPSWMVSCGLWSDRARYRVR